jgi:hypothetical protein
MGAGALTVGNSVERAYRRGDLLDQRRRLMERLGARLRRRSTSVAGAARVGEQSARRLVSLHSKASMPIPAEEAPLPAPSASASSTDDQGVAGVGTTGAAESLARQPPRGLGGYVKLSLAISGVIFGRWAEGKLGKSDPLLPHRPC